MYEVDRITESITVHDVLNLRHVKYICTYPCTINVHFVFRFRFMWKMILETNYCISDTYTVIYFFQVLPKGQEIY